MPALPRAAAPKRRGLFPMTATSCCFSVTVQGGDPLCHTHVCRHTPTGQLTLCSGALGSSHVPRLQQHLVCPPRSPQRQACPAAAPWLVGHKRAPCSLPQALLRGTLPAPSTQRVFSLPSHLFLRVSPLFQQAKATPSLHLPSLSGSQLFFLLFSASHYPGAKNNKEFTALDLELSPAQLRLCAVSANH